MFLDHLLQMHSVFLNGMVLSAGMGLDDGMSHFRFDLCCRFGGEPVGRGLDAITRQLMMGVPVLSLS